MLWPRVDQKTCLKSLVLGGVKVVPMPMKRIGDQLCTDVEGLHAKVSELGPDRVLGIVTTTSCFAPRAADDVVAVAKLCAQHSIGHIIGTGIFSTPSSILKSVGSVGASMFLWALGAILSFCGLMIWLELGTTYPRSGGEKVYLEAMYKRPKYLVTVMFAADAILLGFTASGCIVRFVHIEW